MSGTTSGKHHLDEPPLAAKRKPPPPPSSTVRVMQWNVLADGMSDDGFLVRDVLGDDVEGGAVDVEALAELLSVKGVKGSRVDDAGEAFTSERARKNHAKVVDWQRRWTCICQMVETLQPDIITLQEFDRFAQAKAELATLGFSCAADDAPADYDLEEIRAVEKGDYEGYLRRLKSAQRAFAPTVPSTCRNRAVKCGVPNPQDDGVAIFWRSERWRTCSWDLHP